MILKRRIVIYSKPVLKFGRFREQRFICYIGILSNWSLGTILSNIALGIQEIIVVRYLFYYP